MLPRWNTPLRWKASKWWASVSIGICRQRRRGQDRFEFAEKGRHRSLRGEVERRRATKSSFANSMTFVCEKEPSNRTCAPRSRMGRSPLPTSRCSIFTGTAWSAPKHWCVGSTGPRHTPARRAHRDRRGKGPDRSYRTARSSTRLPSAQGDIDTLDRGERLTGATCAANSSPPMSLRSSKGQRVGYRLHIEIKEPALTEDEQAPQRP